MEIRNVFAGIMTAYPEVAVDWYTHVFDRKPDQNPMEMLYEWNFADGGVLQLVKDRERAGKSSITLLVSDIEATKKSLSDKNIPTGEVTEGELSAGITVRTITIVDPENNRITFAEQSQHRETKSN